MAIYPSTIVQIESINRELIAGLDKAIDKVFKDKLYPLKSDAQNIIDVKDRIDTGLMRKSVISGILDKNDINTLFLEDSAIRKGRKTDYVSFQELGTKFISPALFLTGSFEKNTKDIPQLLDEETQKIADKL